MGSSKWYFALLFTFAVSAIAANDRYIVATSLYLREQPALEASAGTKLPIATHVEIEKTKNEWVNVVVRSGDQKGQRGWLKAEYLVTEQPTLKWLFERYDSLSAFEFDERRMWAERAVALAPKDAGASARLRNTREMHSIYVRKTGSSVELQQLSKRLFRVTDADGRVTLSSMSNYGTHFDVWNAFYGKPCAESVASANFLDESTHAEIVQDREILAFLGCGMGDSSPREYVVAFFDPRNVESPRCAAIVDLAERFSNSWVWGRAQSFDVRKAPNDGYNIVVTAGGGDGGYGWGSLTVIQLQRNCSVRTAFGEATGTAHSQIDSTCEGKQLRYRFINNETLEVINESAACVPAEKRESSSTRRINLAP